MFEILCVCALVGSFSSCYEWNNPLDEKGSAYQPPTISVDYSASSQFDNDTTHFDSIIISLIGNKPQSLFRTKIDKNNWLTDWLEAGVFGIGNLSDGKHVLYIYSKFSGGDSVVSDSITFFVQVKGYKPEFSITTDTTVFSDTGRTITLNAIATSVAKLSHSWMNKSFLMPNQTGDTLKFDPFLIRDTSSYQCIAFNEFGRDTSRVFRLKFRPPTGGITGIVADAESNKILPGAKVALWPSDKSITTDTNGQFSFKGLSAKTYSLNITISGYVDSSITKIAVDSETTSLPIIKLHKIIMSKVIYLGNGNDTGTVPVDGNNYKPGTVVTIRGNSGKLNKKGYAFDGWSKTKDGNGTVLSPADTFAIGKIDDTLYAVWKINQYSVTFIGNNNGSGTPPEKILSDYNSNISIPDKRTLEKPGYSFSGWNENQEGTGKNFTVNQSFTIPDSNLVLYAKWEKLPTFKVVYSGNDNTGGAVPIDTNSYYNGQKVVVMGNPDNLEKTGFAFAGWNTHTDGVGDDYNAGATFSMPSSSDTLYAKWTTNPTYSIIYNGNSNTGGQAPATVNFDSIATITIADSGTLFKTGYSFAGWNTLQNGSGKTYKAGDKQVMDTVNITLYAQWLESRYVVTYHGNGNTSGIVPPSSNHLYGSKATVASPGNLEKIGYTFYCWNTDSIGSGVDYNTADQITMKGADINLYARWIINKYNVSFNSKGGNNIVNQSVKHNDTVQTPQIPVKQSYIFAGWFKDSMCQQQWDFKTKITESVTLYAKWIIIDIDGNLYTEILIGNQVWMVENLMTLRYRDSTQIPLVVENDVWKNLETPGYCWYPYVFASNKKFGALYNWYVVTPENLKKLAPAGWHVPTDEEWNTLITHLGGENIAGGKLKETDTLHWSAPNSDASNMSGFFALPGGRRYYNGTFDLVGTNSAWWTATLHYSENPLYYGINCYNSDVVRTDAHKKTGLSIRCIRDW